MVKGMSSVIICLLFMAAFVGGLVMGVVIGYDWRGK